MKTLKNATSKTTEIRTLKSNETPCFCYINHYSWIGISGDATASFLQGQFSCDISTLENGQATLGAYCDPKGRVIANFFLVYWHHDYYIWLPDDMRSLLINTLNKYAPFSRVKVLPIEPEWQAIGASPRTILPNALQETTLSLPITASHDFQLILAPNNQLEPVLAHLKSSHYQEKSSNLWSFWLIQAELAFITPATSGKLLPQMLALDTHGAISFTKGCYLGQEIIARTQHLGQLKRHLHSLSFTSTQKLQTGDTLQLPDGNEGGLIVALVHTHPNHYQILAVIQDRHWEALSAHYSSHHSNT